MITCVETGKVCPRLVRALGIYETTDSFCKRASYTKARCNVLRGHQLAASAVYVWGYRRSESFAFSRPIFAVSQKTPASYQANQPCKLCFQDASQSRIQTPLIRPLLP